MDVLKQRRKNKKKKLKKLTGKETPESNLPIGQIVITVFPENKLKVEGIFPHYSMMMEILGMAIEQVGAYFLAQARAGKVDKHGNIIHGENPNETLLDNLISGKMAPEEFAKKEKDAEEAGRDPGTVKTDPYLDGILAKGEQEDE